MVALDGSIVDVGRFNGGVTFNAVVTHTIVMLFAGVVNSQRIREKVWNW